MAKRNTFFTLLFTLSLFSANAQNDGSPYSAMTPFIETLMDSLNIPGVHIVVTKGNEIEYIKGFGVENIETGKAVDPYRSKFYIGSITKTFTGVAIQEAVNRGILDKDTDISQYLDFEFDRPFNDKITLNHLMSHSSGLDDKEFYCCTFDYTNTASLKEHFLNLGLSQIRPAGELMSYSGLGVALAGYILEIKGGQSVLDYYHDYIFTPLEMNNSGVYLDSDTPNQPMSYVNTPDGLYPVGEHWGTILYTEGRIHTTAEDMGKYMIGLLSPDSLQITRDWNENLLSQIGSPVFTYSDNDRFSWGFGITATKTANGLVHSHNGSMEHFMADMHLFVEEKVGIYINCNSNVGHLLNTKLVPFFMERYLKEYADPPIVSEETKLPGNYEGTYSFLNYPQNDVGKIKLLTYLPQYQVRLKEDGNLEFHKTGSSDNPISVGNNTELFIPIGNGKFADTTKLIHRTLSLGKSGDRHIIKSSTPFSVPVLWTLQKLHWYETVKFQFPYRMLSLFIFLIVPLIWLVAYLIKRNMKKIDTFKVILATSMWAGLLSAFSVFYLFTAHKDFTSYYVNNVAWEVTSYSFFNILQGVLVIVGTVLFIYGFGKFKIAQKIYYSFLILFLLGYALNNLVFHSYNIVF